MRAVGTVAGMSSEAPVDTPTDDLWEGVDLTAPTDDALGGRAPETGAPEPHATADVRDIPAALLEGLNSAQRAAVETLSGPLLVVAGPGSGKTRVLVHRIAALLATGTKPWQILAVTFTNKAAAEMRERIAALVGERVANDMWVATFHSACVRMLRYHYAAAGLPRSFAIVDASDAQRLVTEVMTGLGQLEGLNPQESKQLIKSTYSLISRAKNDARSAADLARSPHPDHREAAAVMEGYNARLRQIGAVDFDDILLRTLQLLQGNPEIAETYQRKFRHVLVDEYQDTNAVQYQITRILSSGSGNLCVVGDHDQSIYAFRGATPEALSALTRDYPNTKVVVLEQNYRSTQRILEVAQAVIDPNPAVHRARLFTENEAGAPVRFYTAFDNDDEAAWVVDQIRADIAAGGDPADHAVLVRVNAQTRSLESELAKSRIAYQVVGALRFYDRAEVKDALSYLRVAANPADELALRRCINTPRRGIGEATVAALLTDAHAAGRSGVDEMRARLSAGKAGKLTAFLDLFEVIAEAASHGPGEALRAVAEATGMRKALKEQSAKDGVDREANLDELIGFAETFVRTGAPTDPEARTMAELSGWDQTVAFLENVALVSAAEMADGSDEEPLTGRVSLLTSHSAKGKEFGHVYVVGLEENLFPHTRAIRAGDDALAEERRLLFVAVSRAQKTLALSRCMERYMFGKITRNEPSRYLEDLPAGIKQAPPRQRPLRPGGGYSLGRGGIGAGRPGAARSNGGSIGGGGTPAWSPPPVSTFVHPVGAPASSGPRLTAEQAQPGARVKHALFGDGVIAEADRRTVTIDFTSGQQKVLSLQMAPLTLQP